MLTGYGALYVNTPFGVRVFRLQKTSATTINSKIKPPTLMPTVLPISDLLRYGCNGTTTAKFQLSENDNGFVLSGAQN